MSGPTTGPPTGPPTGPTVSVIVVSRGRPDALRRCLMGIEQLFFKAFELIVVTDPPGAAVVQAWDRAGTIRLIGFAEANISKARNLGLAAAAGEVVAFIDDDAVPEPTWLDHLARPFSDPAVAAAGGYVRGRNGISFQSSAQTVDACGWPAPLDIAGDQATVLQGAPGRAIKTEGTNCAFRRGILLRLGGFDPGFHFYMDETDVNLRLAAEGHRTAIVPLAQVHHGFAASAQRHHSRMPRTLFDVGASHMLLLRKHARPDRIEPSLNRLRAEQRARVLRHMVAGTCEPRDVPRILQTLEDGIADGRRRGTGPLGVIRSDENAFQSYVPNTEFSGSVLIAGRSWLHSRLHRRAAEQVANGTRASLFLFSPTALFHRVSFGLGGYWVQSGGLFGKSRRSDPLLQVSSFAKRVKRESARVRHLRGLTK